MLEINVLFAMFYSQYFLLIKRISSFYLVGLPNEMWKNVIKLCSTDIDKLNSQFQNRSVVT